MHRISIMLLGTPSASGTTPISSVTPPSNIILHQGKVHMYDYAKMHWYLLVGNPQSAPASIVAAPVSVSANDADKGLLLCKKSNYFILKMWLS